VGLSPSWPPFTLTTGSTSKGKERDGREGKERREARAVREFCPSQILKANYLRNIIKTAKNNFTKSGTVDIIRS